MSHSSVKRPSRAVRLVLFLLFLGVLLVVGLLILRPGLAAGAERLLRLRAWFADPASHPDWSVQAGVRCHPESPMIMPTSGYIGFGWGDRFRPGHSHTGYDIFSPDGRNNVTPVVAAFDGYLTREADWRSAVIIRHPDFPAIVPGEQIWTYYTHMASADGQDSYVSDRFPPGTREVFVPAGTLLGFQGNWSGRPNRPTGLHLHFSVVKSTSAGGYANETDIGNTYDPARFLGLAPSDSGVLTCAGTWQ